MNQLFEDATDRQARHYGPINHEIERADWTPLADIYEHAEEYMVAVDLPGIDRDTMVLDFEDERLTIKGTRVTAASDHSQHRVERPQGKFNRSFGIPATVDAERIGAEYKDGVLYIRLPKRKEQKGQPVRIKVS
jgi:HSP20 family protein